MSRTGGPPASAIRRVPVGETVRAAYAAVFGSLGLLLKAAALPFLLSLAILGLAMTAGANAFLSLLLTVLGFVPYTLFGVAWHRLTLLGPVQGAPVAFPSWRRRHWRFMGYVVAITGLFYLLAAPYLALGVGARGTVIGGPGLLLLIAALLAGLIGLPYVLMRLAFVFPAVAVDENYTLKNSWAHTRGQGFRLLGTLFLTALPLLFAVWMVGSALGVFLLPEIAETGRNEGMSAEEALRQTLSDNAGTFAIAQLVLAAMNYILMSLMVSAVSIAFRLCTGWVPAPAANPPAASPPTLGANGDRGGAGP